MLFSNLVYSTNASYTSSHTSVEAIQPVGNVHYKQQVSSGTGQTAYYAYLLNYFVTSIYDIVCEDCCVLSSMPALSLQGCCKVGRHHGFVVLCQSSSRPFLLQDEAEVVGAAVHLRPRSPMADLAEAGVP